MSTPTDGRRPLRILYAPGQGAYTRNQESTLALLAERGHRIHIAYSRTRGADDGIPERLAARHEHVTVGPAPKRGRSSGWGQAAWN